MMLTLLMPRVYLPTETLASILMPDLTPVCKTLELPWRDNLSSKSCIPEDTYIFVKMPPGAGRDYGYFRCAYVKGRTMNVAFNMSTILMHPGDHPNDSLGCILVGSRHVDLDHDNIPDLAESKVKLLWLHQNLPDAFYLKIYKKAS